MKSQNKETGRLGEDMAADFLVKKGYKILDRNYSTKFGELDIVALDLSSSRMRGSIPNTLVFVEVKTKTSDQFGSPEEMINPHKLHQIHNTAQSYLLSHPSPFPCCHPDRAYPRVEGSLSESKGISPLRFASVEMTGALRATPLLRIDAICINLETKTIKHYENLTE